MNIGILGGTFDPPHIGHLIIAQEAAFRFGLERVLFVPAGQPYLKIGRSITPAHHRVEMVRRAIASNPLFAVSMLEVEREGPSYTVDTLIALHKEWGPEAHLYFIIGLDLVEEIPRWHQPERLLSLCQVIVLARPGYEAAVGRLEEAIPGALQRLLFLEGLLIGISATDIRQRVAQGLPIRYLVPQAVGEYIRDQGLYRA